MLSELELSDSLLLLTELESLELDDCEELEDELLDVSPA